MTWSAMMLPSAHQDVPTSIGRQPKNMAPEWDRDAEALCVLLEIVRRVISSSGEPTVCHSGDIANFHSDVALLPAHRLGVVVLMNVNGALGFSANCQGVIVQGVQQLLLGQQAPEKSGFQAQYMLFDAALFICSSLAVWALIRLLRRRNQPPRRGSPGALTGVALPLLWETALPLGIFIGSPFLAQSSWALTLLFFPDLGYWLLALSILLLLTGGVRLLVLVRHRLAAPTRERPSPSSDQAC
jgi:hypothetical protein